MTNCESPFADFRLKAPNPPDLAERVLRAAQLAHPIFVAQGWTWGGTLTEAHTPTVEEIADSIKAKYDYARGSHAGIVSSGRLTVYRDEETGEMTVEIQLADLRDEVPGWEDAYREAQLLGEIE